MTYDIAPEITKSVGASIKALRKMRGLSLTKLAAKVGINYQQLQRYECAENRISASVLWKLHKALNCQMADFFVGVKDE